MIAASGLIEDEEFNQQFDDDDIALSIEIDAETNQIDYDLEPSLVLFSLVLAVARPITAFGLWRFKYWGWALAMMLTGVMLTTDLVAYFRGADVYLSMLINIIIIFYLNQRGLRAAFGAAKAGSDE